MSRIGNSPITVPGGVDVTIAGSPNGSNTVTVKGPKGTLTMDLLPGFGVAQEGTEVTVRIR